MTMKKFKVNFEDRGYVIVELNQKVIDGIDDKWRKLLYNLNDEEIIQMIIQMIILCFVYGCNLSQLDEWVDQPNENARIIENKLKDCESGIESIEEI